MSAIESPVYTYSTMTLGRKLVDYRNGRYNDDYTLKKFVFFSVSPLVLSLNLIETVALAIINLFTVGLYGNKKCRHFYKKHFLDPLILASFANIFLIKMMLTNFFVRQLH